MAISQITIDINELEGQRLGYLGVSLSDWTATTVSQYSAGSKIECGGSMYGVTSLENMGTVGEWGAIANSTLVYSYFNPSSVDFHFTSTAPTWSEAKQGYYGTGGSATYRYISSIYKDSTGAYAQKTILIDREHGITSTGVNLGSAAANADHVLRFATDAKIKWNEATGKFEIDNTVNVTGTVLASKGFLNGYIHSASQTQNAVFDTLAPFLPNLNDSMLVNGSINYVNPVEVTLRISRAVRTLVGSIAPVYDTIELYGVIVGPADVLSSKTCTDGSAATFTDISIAW
jgi:hypothetical protein